MAGNETKSDPGASALDQLAINTIRTLAIDSIQRANSGHPGAPMGLAATAYVLWTRIMRFNPAGPRWPDRDRLILSAGHASMLLYTMLHLCGYDLPMDQLKRFRQWGSITAGHPEYHETAGIEMTTGPLGQGFGTSVGLALGQEMAAARFNRHGHDVVDYDVYCICSDGDLQEGLSTEAASLAGHLGLGRLVAIYDDNKVQLSGPTDTNFSEDVAAKFRALGWHTVTLADGATLSEIELAILDAKSVRDRPSLIVDRTHIGFGSPHKQDSHTAHGSPLGEEEVKLTKEALGWPPDKSFYIPEEVAELYAACRTEGARAEEEWNERFERYAKAYPDLAEEFELFQNPYEHLPALASRAAPTFEPKDGPMATRKACGKALNWAAPFVPKLVGGSADLDPSTLTHLDADGDVATGRFDGRNVFFGVREHAMGAIVNGLTRTGFRAFGATFFAFYDYMRPAVRLAALMGIPSMFIYSHDSIGLGEDGPTHQPVEQLVGLRSVPDLAEIRPADANETAQAVRFALTRMDGPTAIVTSRQALPIIDPAKVPPDAVALGAYVLEDAKGTPDVILIGSGSEVSLCVEAAQRLRADGVGVRVVSMPSWFNFESQSKEYRDGVLPPSVTARVSAEAACTLGWSRWVGDRGVSMGVDRFGASAPAKRIFEEFGLTAENVARTAHEVLGR